MRWVPLLLLSFCALPLGAAEYHIAPGGNNAGAGTLAQPWGTFAYAIGQLAPGDTLIAADGTYALTSRIRIQDGGTATQPITIRAADGAVPILDFAGMTVAWGGSSGRGIQIDQGADYIHLRGLTIQNARDNGIYSGASHGVLERTVTRWNGDSGVQLSDTASYNQIINADSYENYDPSNNGENADGFALKFPSLGPGNVIRGARAWGNADDGWDMWESTTGGVLVEDSWSYDNGRLLDRFLQVDALESNDLSASTFQGDGNGFKLGEDGGPHVLNRVVVWENAVRGIDVNGNGFGVTVNNATVYNSGRNWQFDETTAQTTNQHVLRNNISLAGSASDQFLSGVDHAFNTWNGIPVAEADFVSLDDTIARGPRGADGSLPVSDFLRLVANSPLVDAGTNVGLPFTGDAPDLGAYESTVPTALQGDFNADGLVDAADYVQWRDHLGEPDDVGISSAGDGLAGVTTGDYAVWQANFGSATPPAAAASSVAEPASLAALAAALCATARVRFAMLP